MATFLFLAMSSKLPAQKQKKDTLAPLREFMSIVSGYKQIPLYLEMEVQNKTNLVTDENDTATMYGEFYLQKENAYVRFGDYEQLVNGGTALIVMHKASAMVLYEDAESVITQMKAMLGAVVPDSSIKEMATIYSSAIKDESNGVAAIELKSRVELLTTGLPRVQIRLEFDTRQRQPQKITMVNRTLVALESSEYMDFSADKQYAPHLLKTDEDYYFIKERETVFMYKKLMVNKEAEINVPVLIKNRVEKGDDGEYKPVKMYDGYTLTKY